MQYRRVFIPGATYFFTVNLVNRKSNLLVDEIEKLKSAISAVKLKHQFKIDAVVIMPDHLHMIMTLSRIDADYSQIWNLIKGGFSRGIDKSELISTSRKLKHERGIWQRRFWEHLIRDEKDFENHVNYIHINPVKHGYVSKPADWKHSSIHRYIEKGIIPSSWGCEINFDKAKFGE